MPQFVNFHTFGDSKKQDENFNPKNFFDMMKVSIVAITFKIQKSKKYTNIEFKCPTLGNHPKFKNNKKCGKLNNSETS